MASDFQLAFGTFMGMDAERAAASDIKSLLAQMQGAFSTPEYLVFKRPEVVDVFALATSYELSLIAAMGGADWLRIIGIDLDQVPEFRIVPDKTQHRIAEENSTYSELQTLRMNYR